MILSFLCIDDSLILKNKLMGTRADKELSQAEPAGMAGVSHNTVSFIETDRFCSVAKLALILCIALDKKFEYIFCF